MLLKYQFIKKRASQKNWERKFKNRASQVELLKKRASQVFLDPIQNRALSRSVQLEVVYLEALLHLTIKLSKHSFCRKLSQCFE